MTGTLKCTFLSGVSASYELTPQQFKDFQMSFEKGLPFTFADKYQRGIRGDMIASFSFDIEVEEPVQPVQPVLPTFEKTIEPYVTGMRDHFAKKETNNNQFVVKIECKCGEEYINSYPYYKTKEGCRNCSKILFLDKGKGYINIDTVGTKGMLMTNRYVVDR